MPRYPFLIPILLFWVSCSAAQDLPGNELDLRFEQYMQGLDLEDLADYDFSYKKGGTSIGIKIAEHGHRKSGAFVPPNSSSDPEAEVVSYRLARWLGISDIYNPVAYYQLGPKATARMRQILKKHSESEHWRSQNYDCIGRELRAHPDYIFGIYRHRPKGKKYPVDGLCSSGTLNTGHRLALLIQAGGPMPSDKPMTFPGVKGRKAGYPRPFEKEDELARQLSSILVVDLLMGQWDRCSGGNLEALGQKDGRLQFLARDNGGATISEAWKWHELNNQWVSRYDRAVVSRLQRLNALLKGASASPEGFADVEKLKEALGFRRAESYRTFRKKLEMLVEKRIPELTKKYGDRAFFASREIAQLRSVDEDEGKGN
jgi:hypothetical protein